MKIATTGSKTRHQDWGNYTDVAALYHLYPNYAAWAVDAVAKSIDCHAQGCVTVDIGAGTGKLTKLLAAAGASGFAIEPNEAMLRQGRRDCKESVPGFAWSMGSAEATGLQDNSVDWACLGSSFHWADGDRALIEAHRILRPGGHLTMFWDLRDNARDPLFPSIDASIHRHAPDIQRAPTIIREIMDGLEARFERDGQFERLLALQAPHREVMSAADYLGAWRTVRDIAAQTTPEQYDAILNDIATLVAKMEDVPMNMRTYAWTASVRK